MLGNYVRTTESDAYHYVKGRTVIINLKSEYHKHLQLLIDTQHRDMHDPLIHGQQ